MKLSPLYCSLIFFLIILCGLSLSTGMVPLTQCFADKEMCQMLVLELRLPRTLLAILGGASLGLAGAALQGLLRNPLADPGIIGVSAGAAFGTVCILIAGVGVLGVYLIPLAGIAGATLVAVVLLAMNKWSHKHSTHTILGGIVLNSLFGGLTILALSLSQNPYAQMEAVFWLLGSLSQHTYGQILLILPFLSVGVFLLLRSGSALDAFSFGEDMAYTLGFPPRKVYQQVVLGIALIVGPLVAVVGIIGFVGLVVPHMLRPLVGYKPQALLLPSAFGGACLVLAADLVVRVLPTAAEMKVGVITSLIGAPFFIYILLKSYSKNYDLF